MAVFARRMVVYFKKEGPRGTMDAYGSGVTIGIVVVAALIAWLIISAIVKTVKFNVIKKQQGAEAAQEFWNAKKTKKAKK